MKFYNILIIILTILFTCNQGLDFKAKLPVKFNNTEYYPSLIDTSKFELFNYFDENFLNRFISEIEFFKKSDKVSFPDSNIILFTGSSSIRMWNTLIEDMQPLTVIKRGFGGATIPEIIFFAENIIFSYQPSVIVFYCGENDLYFNNSVDVYETFQYFEKLIHSKLPETYLYFVSIKPSPSRKHWWKKISMSNRYIQYYCSITESTEYIDVASKMFNNDFSINENIFSDDRLHLNSEGYALWKSIIKPTIEKNNYLKINDFFE
jgi:lysophospholipase L1-like esterase